MDKKAKSKLKAYVSSFYDIQRMRVGVANRIGVRANGMSQKRSVIEDNELSVLHKTAEAEELRYKNLIMQQVGDFEIYTEFLMDVKGIGPITAAMLIAYLDPYCAPTPSSFYRYAGLTPKKETKFNRKLKTKLIGVIGESFLKSSSPYKKFYDDYKNRKTYSAQALSKSHIHQMSIRYMVKMFLYDLWVEWRTQEDLETRALYAEEYLNRKHHSSDYAIFASE